MSDRISLARWRDAKTDPPEEKGRMYHTDLGLLYLRAFAPKVEWVVLDDEGRAHVQHPRVYCEDPSPSGDDALNVDDLRRAHDALLYASGNVDHGVLTVVDPEGCEAAAARLRRAIQEVIPKEN